MANLQRYADGEDAVLETSVESAWRTMALVEACYDAAKIARAPIADLPERKRSNERSSAPRVASFDRLCG
jgi:hypothetical protein